MGNSRKLKFCLAGGVAFAFEMGKATISNTFIVATEKAYSIDTKIIGANQLQIHIGEYENISLNCSMIADLAEDNPVYSAVLSKITGIDLTKAGRITH